jgi:hypothetical protein
MHFLGPGELKLKISHEGTPNLTILRDPQKDLTMAFDRKLAPFTPDMVEELHDVVNGQPTKRTFAFFNLQDMHAFQQAITGFWVKYDSLARDFTISRRRAVGTLSTKSKRLEAGLTRVQLVSTPETTMVQLVAFFDDHFEPARAMGFIIRSTDVFEKYDGKQAGTRAKVGVRLVDARFSLPRNVGSKGAGKSDYISKGFLSLDVPEPATENDDIFIGFDEERGMFLMLLLMKRTNYNQNETNFWLLCLQHQQQLRLLRNQVYSGGAKRRITANDAGFEMKNNDEMKSKFLRRLSTGRSWRVMPSLLGVDKDVICGLC